MRLIEFTAVSTLILLFLFYQPITPCERMHHTKVTKHLAKIKVSTPSKIPSMKMFALSDRILYCPENNGNERRHQRDK